MALARAMVRQSKVLLLDEGKLDCTPVLYNAYTGTDLFPATASIGMSPYEYSFRILCL